MASAELLTSPPPQSSPPQPEPVIVVDDSDEEQGEPNSKRRRTMYDTETSENVIDLTEVDERTSDDHFRFRIIPKIIRLPPFQFTEYDDEPDGMPLESLRAHLQRLFGSGVLGIPPSVEEIPSPINPDELEITGVKESTNPSLSTSTTTTTTTVTATATKRRGNSPLSPSTTSTKEKEKEKDKGKGEVSLECAICLGSMKRITATTCGHVFCYECIKQAIQITKCCPMCKKKLTLRSIHPLYL